MRRKVLTIAALAAGLTAFAQSPDSEWTLEDCIKYGLENSVKVQTQQVAVDNQAISLQTSRLSRLPSLSAGIGEDVSFGRSQNRYGVTEDNNSYNTSINANASIVVFEGFKINNQIKSDKFSLEAARQELEQSRQDLSLEIVGYYMQLLYSEEALKIAKEQQEINRNLVEKTKKMVDGGRSSVSELCEAESSLAASESTRVEAENGVSNAILDLVQGLNYPDYHGFSLKKPDTDALVDQAILTLTPPEEIYESYAARRPAVLAAQNRVEMAKKDVKVAESQLWPSITLGVNYGTGFYSAQKLASGDGSFFNQLGSNGQAVIGASLRIPIFNRMATCNTIRQQKNKVRAQELALQQNKLDAMKEVQQAYVNAKAALGKYQASQKSVAAAKNAFEFEQKKYENGRSTAFQFNEVRQKYATAAAQLIQAKYNFLFRAKILDFYKGNPLI